MKTKLTLLCIVFLSVTMSYSAQTKTKTPTGDTTQQKINHNSVRSNKATVNGDFASSQVTLKEGVNITPVASNVAINSVKQPVFHSGKLFSFTGSASEYNSLGSTCNCANATIVFTTNNSDCTQNCKLINSSKK